MHRWLTEEGRSGLDKSFIPFGGGARKCMGYNFAILEIKVGQLQSLSSLWLLHNLNKLSWTNKGNIPIWQVGSIHRLCTLLKPDEKP